MATIYYNIDSGEQPFTASINPAVASDNIHTSTGSFYFTNIPDGEYVITIVDNIGCQAVFDADVYCFTTTTTTAIPTTTTTTILPTTTTTTLVPTTTTTTTECCPVVYNSSLGGFQMAHALINDGTYLYAGERINNATPSSVARIIKYNTNLQEVDSYDVGANKDVESMCYDSVNNRIYATQVGGVGANEVSILIINPVTMNPVSETTYSTLITGEGFTIVTDGTYIYGATYAAPPVIFKIRISDMALVSTVTWTGRERAHASRIDTRYGYMYLTDIPYSASTDPYFAKVRLSSLAYTEVNIGAYVRKATDDFAMIDTGSDIYCYIGGEYVYSSGGNAGYGGVQVRVSDLSLTGIAMKTTYAVCEYGDEIYSATIDGNMQIFSRHDLNDVLTCNLSGYYPNELNVLGNRLFGTNFYNYNEADGRVLEFNLCYYFPTTTTTSTTLIPPTTSTTTTLPPTTTTTTTLPPTTTTTTTIQETVLVNWSSDIEGNIEFTIFEDGVLQETITTTDSGSFYISSGDTVLVVANIMNCSPSISSYTMDITQSGSGTGNGGGCPTFLSSSASLVSNGTTMTIVLNSVVITTTTTTTPAPTTTTTTLAPVTTTTTTTIPVNFDINYTCVTGTQASITISNFSGGSGSYQSNPVIVFSSEDEALTNNNWDEAWNGQTYLAINNGTWWVAIRDTNNHSNIVAKSVTFDCSITTTTTTTEPVLNPYQSSGSGNVSASGCDMFEYPLDAMNVLDPDSIVLIYYNNAGISWSDIEYIQITSITSDPLLIWKLGSSEINVNDIIYTNGQQYSWDGENISIWKLEESSSDQISVLKFKAKITGYQLGVELTFTFTWDGCIEITTTTTTLTPTTTTTTTITYTIFVPGGFSPNGDGVNDYFVVYNLEHYPTHKMSIFNSFGNLLYQRTNNYHQYPWDGRYNGTFVAAGNYTWVLEINGSPYDSGTVMVAY